MPSSGPIQAPDDRVPDKNQQKPGAAAVPPPNLQQQQQQQQRHQRQMEEKLEQLRKRKADPKRP